jgi:hypothetical protein
MDRMANEFPCLYCGDRERPRTAEHVLQKGLGAEMILPEDVCDECNTKVFSPLDGDLVRYVRTIAYCDHPDVRVTRTFLQEAHPLVFQDGAWISVRVEKNTRWVILPQIVFLGGGRLQVSLDTSAGKDAAVALLANMQKELAEPSTLNPLKTTIVDNRQSEVAIQPALIRSAPRKYCVRAHTREAADEVAADVATGRLLANLRSLSAADDRTYERPGVLTTLSVNLGHIERAVAKVALNFVCKIAGPGTARNTAFDRLRAFALLPILDGKNEFVMWYDRAEADSASFLSKLAVEGHHSLAVLGAGDIPCVFLALYGRPFMLVRLTSGPAPGVLPHNPAVVALFDYRRKTHEIVSAADAPLAFIGRFSLRPNDRGPWEAP